GAPTRAPGGCASRGSRPGRRDRHPSRARPPPRARRAWGRPTWAWPPGAAARRRSRTRAGRWSREDLPGLLVAVELFHGVGVERMPALGDVDVLGLAAERGGEVALAGVVDDRHHRRQLGVATGQLERGGHVAAARDAAEDALLAGQPPGDVHALLGGGGDHAGEQRDVQVSGHEAVADALDAVVAPRAPREECALGRLYRVELHLGITAPQVAAHPGEQAARALRVHEGADAAARLLPQLGPGGEDMGLDVVGVVELARHPVAPGRAVADLAEAVEGEVHVALPARGEDQL